jgi:ferredoxin-thioredoxin reductase catalytic subunit
MTPEQLYEALRKVQEPKGYMFNKDKDWVLNILKDLLVNKERYGYTSCPCRLASGDREKDRDIVCPCVYRADDVAEYGSCYCNLNVSQGLERWHDRAPYVRRGAPLDKMPF